MISCQSSSAGGEEARGGVRREILQFWCLGSACAVGNLGLFGILVVDNNVWPGGLNRDKGRHHSMLLSQLFEPNFQPKSHGNIKAEMNHLLSVGL